MEETIQKLYEEINFIGFYSTYHRDNNYVEKANELLPQIIEFVEWFMQGNFQEIDVKLYECLQQNLLEILKDCNEAFRQKDRVLLMDALEQGLMEYLKLFLPEEYLEEVKTVNVKSEENSEL